MDYVRYLEKSSPHVKRAKEPNTLEHYAQGYQDYLQMPLQVGVNFDPKLRFDSGIAFARPPGEHGV